MTITETFYDCPKPFEDGRQGVHTTKLGEMVQKLFLQVHWESDGLSKREMIIKMGLRSHQDMHDLQTNAYWDFTQKLYSLLGSVFTQLQKKGALDIIEVLMDT